ncbi:S8 family serine peptidase, partial [Candidatus Omnitrophota bacterium]
TTDPSTPVLTNLVMSYEFDTSGNLIKKDDPGTGDVYEYYADTGRMSIKILPDGTEYHYYNEAFDDNGTVGDTSDDFGRIYKTVMPSGDTYIYEDYFTGTDLKGKVVETGTYPGTSYFYYDAYVVGGNETGFTKEDLNTGQTLDYMKRDNGVAVVDTLYYKLEADGAENWYKWDAYVHPSIWPNHVGWMLLSKVTADGEWYAFPYDPTSDASNPTVDWAEWRPSLPLNDANQAAFSLPAWPPSAIETPTGGVPSTISIAIQVELEFPESGGYFSESLEDLKERSLGAGVTVALLDTGVDTETSGIDIVSGYDFAGSNRHDGISDEDYTDSIGHGTEMANVINSVASEADIMALKVFDDTGSTSAEIVASAIRYAVDMGAKVLSMPFSLFPMSTQIETAIDYAFGKGAIIIGAAGNEGTEIRDNSLAAEDKVMAVGSADADGKISAWSNYGEELDLALPWYALEMKEADTEAGTSYSAALAAGITAIMLSETPGMTGEEVLGGIKSLTQEKEDEKEKEIKGVDVNEVVSMYDVQRDNIANFTGYSIKEDVNQNNGELLK